MTSTEAPMTAGAAEAAETAAAAGSGASGVGAGVETSLETSLERAGAPTDDPRALPEKIAAGEYRRALEICAEAYAVPLSRTCMAFTGSQAESEALVEEILHAAYAGFPQYRAGGDTRAWLFGLARRICGRHVELRARTSQTPSQGGIDAQTPERERAARARAALAKLKPSEREAVVLRYEAGLSLRELSIACGVDEASAQKRVSRGLARLRADLGEE